MKPAAARKTNVSNIAMNTNHDGHVTPLDALLVINWLNANTSGQSAPANEFLDVNRDGRLTPTNAL